jgi:hypothetical protein
MTSRKPITTARVHRSKYHRLIKGLHRKVLLNLDLSEIDSFGANRCTPPLPVLTEFGDQPLHRFRLPRGRFDAARLAKDFASRIVRSDSMPGGDTDDEEQDGWRSILFHFKGFGAWLHFENGSVSTYAGTRLKAMRLALKMEKYLLREKETGGKFHLISNGGMGIETECVTLDAETVLSDEDLCLHYGPDAPQWFADFERKITEKKTGLSIFQSIAGCGKTSAIRHLLGKLKKTHVAYYVPPSAVDVIASSSFVSFWSNQQSQHKGKQFISILEDAEQAMLARSGGAGASLVSSLLNLTSGMLGDFVRLQVLATINCRYEEIDSALTRPGRLLTYREFPLIGHERAHRLATKLGRSLLPKSEYTLAEIYNGEAPHHQKSKIIGFAA